MQSARKIRWEFGPDAAAVDREAWAALWRAAGAVVAPRAETLPLFAQTGVAHD